ncbi:MAG: ribosome recycling factor [Deltaproteobacteria bacterium]|nr:ribosome recycling factor [Deltaproteobacteria bacterium]
MAIIDDVANDLKGRIDKTLDDLKKEFARVRTGRANLAILDGVRVDYYGAPTPLNGVANMTVADPRLIIVRPWDKKTLPAIEKAIREANIGINPMNDGDIIRLPIPQLTEERRRDIVKQCKTKGEDHKIAIRNERRDANEMLKEYQKDGEITEDELKKGVERVQKEVDTGITKVDEIVSKKEKEVMEV